MIDCRNLSDRNDFESYVISINEATGGNYSLATECKAEICGALWGSGNPDISGIGMSIGFVLQSLLGSFFTFAFLHCRTTPSSNFRRWKYLLASTFRIFHNSAVFLTFSVQVASVVVLTKVNFGISANGMGANSVKITWVVSLLTLLPLCYGTFVFQVCHEKAFRKHARKIPSSSLLPPSRTPNEPEVSDIGRGKDIDGDIKKANTEWGPRDRVRFLLFVICWMLSVYPFLSRMVNTFGESQIGDATGSVISTVDWGKIQSTCYEGIEPVSRSSELAMNVFGIGGWLFISAITLPRIVLLAIDRQHPDSQATRLLRGYKSLPSHNNPERTASLTWPFILTTLITLLTVIQIWAYFRLQRLQGRMTEAAGNTYADQQWTFGQVVAVSVFAPLLPEALFLLQNRKTILC